MKKRSETLPGFNEESIYYRVYLRDDKWICHVIFSCIEETELTRWLLENAYPVLRSGLTAWFYKFDVGCQITFTRIW